MKDRQTKIVFGDLERSISRRKQRAKRLCRFSVLSFFVHLLVVAVLIPSLKQKREIEEHLITEVDLVHREPEAPKAIMKPSPKKQLRTRRRSHHASRHRVPKKRSPKIEAPTHKEEQPRSPLLKMREPEISLDSPQDAEKPPPQQKDRFSSFWPQGRHPVAIPKTREQFGALEVTRYADGGRVLRSTDGEPNASAMGLMDLAAGKLGHRSGSQACNPYHNWRGKGKRELVLIVDTSGSVVRARRAPASVVCAAGAALAALRRGFAITIINFSSITQRTGPTDDIDIVYKALSTFQAQGTQLPRPSLLKLSGDKPLDYVLISDAAIQNLEKVMPDYSKILRKHPKNRALLYYLGGGGGLENLDPAKALELIKRSGFKAEQVNRLQPG